MSKCDVTVQKKFTLNTGNYTSIAPSVSITVHDILTDDLKEVHKLLEIVADGLLHEQMESDAKTMASIKKLGFKEYFEKINSEEMEVVVKGAIDKLVETPPF